MKMTRAIASLLCVFMLLACLPMQAMAAGIIDTDEPVSLDIICLDDKIALSGVRFDLYHIAHVDENGNVTVNNDLSKYAVSAQEDSETDWKDLAATLEIYVLRDNIPPSDSTQSNMRGLASFPSQGKELKQGLYLVTGQRHSQGDRIYDTEPFLIMLPATDAENGEWLYDTTVYSKFASYKLPDGGEENTIKRKVLKNGTMMVTKKSVRRKLPCSFFVTERFTIQ